MFTWGETRGKGFVFCLCTQIVKEYERAIIFRLGRILKGGAKGPGHRTFHTQDTHLHVLHPHRLFL